MLENVTGKSDLPGLEPINCVTSECIRRFIAKQTFSEKIEDERRRREHVATHRMHAEPNQAFCDNILLLHAYTCFGECNDVVTKAQRKRSASSLTIQSSVWWMD